jgi:competence protein ComEA
VKGPMKHLMFASLLAMASGVAFAGAVNINVADAKTLAKELKGIGAAKAEAIVKYRTEKGPFKSIDELKKVEGVGEATFEANKSNLKLKD